MRLMARASANEKPSRELSSRRSPDVPRGQLERGARGPAQRSGPKCLRHHALSSIVQSRLRRQHLITARQGSVAGLVAWMGAVQAQEYEPARWGIGLRLAAPTTSASIEGAITSGEILRTHVLRPTWHFVAAEDIVWMQTLTGARVQRRMAAYQRQLELDAKLLTRALSAIERALRDGACLTRAEMGDALGRARIMATHQRLAHIAMHAELEGLICSGPRRDRSWFFSSSTVRLQAPNPGGNSRKSLFQAIELTRRFFQSHGPATVRDYVWWSGLATADARRGLQIVGATSRSEQGLIYWSVSEPLSGSGDQRRQRVAQGSRRRSSPVVHLLPIYDEYLVAYRDRVAVPHGPTRIDASKKFVHFQHAIIIDGQVAGTWRIVRRQGTSRADVVSTRPLRRLEKEAIAAAADRFEHFAGKNAQPDAR